jgi:regulator of nonsense transcripts 1
VNKGTSDGWHMVDIPIRIDLPQSLVLRTGDHIRLSSASSPVNAPTESTVVFDAIVQRAEKGQLTARCLQKLPAYYENCSWHLQHCGSFVSTKSMLEALVLFYGEQEGRCRLYQQIVSLGNYTTIPKSQPEPQVDVPTLNTSQNRAVNAAIENPLCLLWGPPGTGKTSTIVELLCSLLQANTWKSKRFLVAAPTHNAVDNVLRRFVRQDIVQSGQVQPLRVSTDVWKVASDLKSYTCDARMGEDLNTNHDAKRKAQKLIKSCKIVFTTCIGANLGLLRNEDFEVVVVDEASQQTEPMTLVPLVKGCEKLILVGDHVQLRATTQQHSKALDMDVSLFERLYTTPDNQSVVKVMLDVQYRMHEQICRFASDEFYGGKLGTAVSDNDRPLPKSVIEWKSRILFAACNAPEDNGQRSKQNSGQAELCRSICQQLLASKKTSKTEMPSVVILTPYTRQLQLLKTMNTGIEVSSIDGFQGQEADIIVYVTVRCNQRRELGFLTDMRRLNVAVTRAKAGMIIIGHRETLVNGADDASAAVWSRLLKHATDLVLIESSG